MFVKGQFVEWKGEDENGTFTHVGKVVDYSVTQVIIEVSPNGSTITIPQNDGTLKEVAKPKEWSLTKPKKEKETTVTTTVRVPRQKSTDGSSKREKALVIYKEMMDGNNHPARKDVMDRFIKELDMTSAGASTYAANCKRELNQ